MTSANTFSLIMTWRVGLLGAMFFAALIPTSNLRAKVAAVLLLACFFAFESIFESDGSDRECVFETPGLYVDC